MGKIDITKRGVYESILEGRRKRNSTPTELVPDDENDRRGQIPTPEECAEIEKQYGLAHGCILLMNGARWYYDRVGTWGEEEGEKPCLWAWKIRECGTTAEDQSLLNVWKIERD